MNPGLARRPIKMTKMTRLTTCLLSALAIAYLTGCGTDSGSGNHGDSLGGAPTEGVSVSTSGGSISGRSTFSLRLTDAPVDGLAKVIVSFTAVRLKRQDGKWFLYTLPAPKTIDLLALHGTTTAELLKNMPIEPGDYTQIRFLVDAAPMANKVELLAGGEEPLSIRNPTRRGLKFVQDFTIPVDRQVGFTVDFDLRQAVKRNKNTGVYKLKSKGRVVVDSNVGVIRGTVPAALLLSPICSDMDPDTHNAVYVFDGHNVIPDDIGEDADDGINPVTTTPINYDSALGAYVFEAAFLPGGDYTIALTCSADAETIGDDEDDGDDNDDDDDDDLKFFAVQNVSVVVTDMTFLKP